MPPHDSAVDLARRLHALTSLLGESDPDSDEAVATLAERQKVLDALATVPFDEETRQWVDQSAELEGRLIQDWSKSLGTMRAEMHASKRAKGAISAYRRNEAAR